MLKLGWLQFKHAWSWWALTSGSLLVAGWMVGTCLTGLLALRAALPTLVAAGHDPRPLFLIPLVLGGVTLFLVLTGIIRAVLNELQAEYRLWAIQGANPRQIASLVAVQLGLTGFFSSLLGWLLAISTISYAYTQLQGWIGTVWLPSVPLLPTLSGALLTVGGVTLLSVIAGFAHTWRILYQAKAAKISRWLRLVFGGGVCVVAIWGLGQTIVQIRQTTGNGLLMAMAWWLLLVIGIGPLGSNGILTAIRLSDHPLMLKLAACQLRQRSEQLSSVVRPLLVLQTLLTGILLALYGFDSGTVDGQNVIVTLLMYIGAPALVVIVNCGGLTTLESHHQMVNLQQLKIAGLTPVELWRERLAESGAYGLVFLIQALVIDGFLYTLVDLSGQARLRFARAITIGVPLIIAGGIWLLVSLINLAWLCHWQRQKSPKVVSQL